MTVLVDCLPHGPALLFRCLAARRLAAGGSSRAASEPLRPCGRSWGGFAPIHRLANGCADAGKTPAITRVATPLPRLSSRVKPRC